MTAPSLQEVGDLDILELPTWSDRELRTGALPPLVDIDYTRFTTGMRLVAALGFGGVAGTASGIAQVLFGLFLIIFVVSLLLGVLRGRPPQL